MKTPSIVTALNVIAVISIITAVCFALAMMLGDNLSLYFGLALGTFCSSFLIFGFAAAVGKLYEIEEHLRGKTNSQLSETKL